MEAQSLSRSSPLGSLNTKLTDLFRRCEQKMSPALNEALLRSSLLTTTPEEADRLRIRDSFFNVIHHVSTTEPHRTVGDLIQALHNLQVISVAKMLENEVPDEISLRSSLPNDLASCLKLSPATSTSVGSLMIRSSSEDLFSPRRSLDHSSSSLASRSTAVDFSSLQIFKSGSCPTRATLKKFCRKTKIDFQMLGDYLEPDHNYPYLTFRCKLTNHTKLVCTSLQSHHRKLLECWKEKLSIHTRSKEGPVYWSRIALKRHDLYFWEHLHEHIYLAEDSTFAFESDDFQFFEFSRSLNFYILDSQAKFRHFQRPHLISLIRKLVPLKRREFFHMLDDYERLVFARLWSYTWYPQELIDDLFLDEPGWPPLNYQFFDIPFTFLLQNPPKLPKLLHRNFRFDILQAFAWSLTMHNYASKGSLSLVTTAIPAWTKVELCYQARANISTSIIEDLFKTLNSSGFAGQIASCYAAITRIAFLPREFKLSPESLKYHVYLSQQHPPLARLLFQCLPLPLSSDTPKEPQMNIHSSSSAADSDSSESPPPSRTPSPSPTFSSSPQSPSAASSSSAYFFGPRTNREDSRTIKMDFGKMVTNPDPDLTNQWFRQAFPDRKSVIQSFSDFCAASFPLHSSSLAREFYILSVLVELDSTKHLDVLYRLKTFFRSLSQQHPYLFFSILGRLKQIPPTWDLKKRVFRKSIPKIKQHPLSHRIGASEARADLSLEFDEHCTPLSEPLGKIRDSFWTGNSPSSTLKELSLLISESSQEKLASVLGWMASLAWDACLHGFFTLPITEFQACRRIIFQSGMTVLKGRIQNSFFFTEFHRKILLSAARCIQSTCPSWNFPPQLEFLFKMYRNDPAFQQEKNVLSSRSCQLVNLASTSTSHFYHAGAATLPFTWNQQFNSSALRPTRLHSEEQFLSMAQATVQRADPNCKSSTLLPLLHAQQLLTAHHSSIPLANKVLTKLKKIAFRAPLNFRWLLAWKVLAENFRQFSTPQIDFSRLKLSPIPIELLVSFLRCLCPFSTDPSFCFNPDFAVAQQTQDSKTPTSDRLIQKYICKLIPHAQEMTSAADPTFVEDYGYRRAVFARRLSQGLTDSLPEPRVFVARWQESQKVALSTLCRHLVSTTGANSSRFANQFINFVLELPLANVSDPIWRRICCVLISCKISDLQRPQASSSASTNPNGFDTPTRSDPPSPRELTPTTEREELTDRLVNRLLGEVQKPRSIGAIRATILALDGLSSTPWFQTEKIQQHVLQTLLEFCSEPRYKVYIWPLLLQKHLLEYAETLCIKILPNFTAKFLILFAKIRFPRTLHALHAKTFNTLLSTYTSRHESESNRNSEANSLCLACFLFLLPSCSTSLSLAQFQTLFHNSELLILEATLQILPPPDESAIPFLLVFSNQPTLRLQTWSILSRLRSTIPPELQNLTPDAFKNMELRHRLFVLRRLQCSRLKAIFDDLSENFAADSDSLWLKFEFECVNLDLQLPVTNLWQESRPSHHSLHRHRSPPLSEFFLRHYPSEFLKTHRCTSFCSSWLGGRNRIHQTFYYPVDEENSRIGYCEFCWTICRNGSSKTRSESNRQAYCDCLNTPNHLVNLESRLNPPEVAEIMKAWNSPVTASDEISKLCAWMFETLEPVFR